MEVEMELDFGSMYTGPTSPTVIKWTRLLKEGRLSSSDFREHWRVLVPQYFTIQVAEPFTDWSFKDSTVDEVLIGCLEEFICQGDKNVIYNHLFNTDYPPSVCGKVFKMGEPTYNCRECGMDATCVLCVSCFKQSDHKNHKYKMGTSGGGGCCDCGDTEAWKKEPYCNTHAAGLKKYDSSTVVKFPADFIERCHLVFMTILKYAYQILTLEYSPGLPSDLRTQDQDPLVDGRFEEEQYCTVLYNDETHTFEQVISTLARVIKCSQRDAIEFVTNIDREGRTVVKMSRFQHCHELKTEIEKFTSRHGTRPLKVQVVHSYVIAHQFYALRLLTWLQKMTSMSEGFRSIFSNVVLGRPSGEQTYEELPIIDEILQRDSTLWKSARLHWHRLFISGMFMEYENKKAFAKHFTKHYGAIMKDFIRDDHDHSFSVASLSIQVFTVPTLAQYLIAHEDVLMILLNTFISECSRKCNKLGKLEFDRSSPIGSFKRASYILYDLRYLLSSPPESWTDELRKGFLQGVSLILTLLTYMQGMDSVTRQLGQHMEYEPEWESAFNLHLKLAPVISLLLRWCATDKIVLVKSYRLTLKKLFETSNYNYSQFGEVRELADHSASCLMYDVSTQPVSIHLPLSRFLAGLHLHLEKYGLTFDSSEFFSLTKQTPEQIIEPVLRTQVMIAQVHSGMWRRNGYSLSNQIFFYHNVKCRGEMLDRDIVLLQVGAALIESNEFLIHVLNKFGLINWANADFETSSAKNPEEDCIKQTINMVEEFLSLLITVIGERYVPGIGNVTVDDCIKNEIMHQLLIKPLSHSEVDKALPDDINHETGMERVINAVATFKKPSQPSGKGVYEIKNEYLDRYNVFFYHYTKEELSKSEEVQRKLRKSVNGLECCPPPVLPPLTDAFSMVSNLLQCDVMLHIMNITLDRAINLRARSFSEAQLHKVLHLIGYALHEEENKYSSFFTFTKRAEKWGIQNLLDELSSSPRVEAHKDLIKWVTQKYRALTIPAQSAAMEAVIDKNAPQSFSSETHEKEFRAKLAAERRAALMAQMATMQANFIKDNAELFQQSVLSSNESSSIQNLEEEEEESTPSIKSPIAVGPNQTAKVTVENKLICILCQEEQVITPDGPAMVLAAFIQKSTVLCRDRHALENSNSASDTLYLNSNMGPATHTGTCGHVMHGTCWKKYIDTIHNKENRRPYRLRAPTSFDIDKNEYLCPLCECLSNTVLPVIPYLHTLENASSTEPVDKLSFNNWLEASLIALTHKQRADKILEETQIKTSSMVTTPSPSVNPIPAGSPQPSSSDTSSGSNGFISVTCNDKPVDELVAGAVSPLANSSPVHPAPVLASEDEDIEDDTGSMNMNVEDYNKIVALTQGNVCMQLRIFNGAAENEASGTSKPSLACGLSEDLLHMVNLFCQVASSKALDMHPHEEDPALPMLAWKTCAYTIHSIEWLLRYTNKSLLGDFTCRQQDGLQNMVRLAGVLGTSWSQLHTINRHGVKLLSMVIDNSDKHPSVIDWDCFGLLVPMTASFPSMFYCDPVPVPSGSALEYHSLLLMFLCHIAQILICVDFDVEELTENVVSEETECFLFLSSLYKKYTFVNTDVMWKKVKANSISFLRCCAIFYHFLTGVPAPEELQEAGGDTYENLCHYLGLPLTCKELLDHDHVLSLFYSWSQHSKIKELQNKKFTREMMPINELVCLPEDYSELINTVSLFTCPNSDREDSRNPTMCLICGEMLCSQTYCCQTELNKLLVGACTYHTHVCGAGAGVFLRVRECEVLLLASPNKGCFRTPPYIDDYGEADQGLRRGNPLHLCKERYRKLQLLWLSHSIYGEIARAIEFAHALIPTQWQHL
uniref:E3 ubiquitin-protein ligase n=1 Tax=Lygus hesperus TaxID=30085 RepID=A0A0A9XCN8_LYGHE